MGEEKPPWIRRHIEARKLVETVTRLKHTHVFTSEEIVRTVGERYRRLRPRRPGKRGKIEFELKRLETVFNVTYSRLRRAAEMPPAGSLSAFHQALLDSYIGIDRYEDARKRVLRGLRLIREFWNQYRWLIATSTEPREAARLRKEASGRMLSVVRRLARSLELLRKVREELMHTHIVAEGLPVVVVAGIPSSGKSTLVSKLSTAEPEVAAYPFTTKSIIVGKVVDKDTAYYIVDTPGVLERPFTQLNEIERKALAALSTLPDVVLFLYDPSLESVQDIESQTRLLESIVNTIVSPRGAALLVAINKSDIAPPQLVRQVINEARKVLERIPQHLQCGMPLVISVATGDGLDELKRALGLCIRRQAPWLYS